MFGRKNDPKKRLERARSKFSEEDPLHYQHVLRNDRLDTDEPIISDEADLDLDWYRENPGDMN